jgi:hypothetical protein
MNLKKKPLFKEIIFIVIFKFNPCLLPKWNPEVRHPKLVWWPLLHRYFCLQYEFWNSPRIIKHFKTLVAYVVFKQSEDSSSHYNICWFKQITIGMSKCFFLFKRTFVVWFDISTVCWWRRESCSVWRRVDSLPTFGEARYLNLSE